MYKFVEALGVGRRSAQPKAAGGAIVIAIVIAIVMCTVIVLYSPRATKCAAGGCRCAAGGAIVIAIVMCTVIVIAEAPAPAGDAGTMLRCYGPTKAFPCIPPELEQTVLLVLYRFVQGLSVQPSGDKVRSRRLRAMFACFQHCAVWPPLLLCERLPPRAGMSRD